LWKKLPEFCSQVPLAGLTLQSFGAIMWAGETAMSTYVFLCQDCHKEFTQSLHMSDLDKSAVTCPHCGSKRVEHAVAAFSAVTSKKS
jgi:putative FmdB family regulatory protein